MTARVRRTFWLLLLAAVLTSGGLSVAFDAPPRPSTGIAVAGLGLVLTITFGLLLRILIVVGRRSPER